MRSSLIDGANHISEVMSWFCTRMLFVIIQVTNLCLRVSRQKWKNGVSMDDSAVLLFAQL